MEIEMAELGFRTSKLYKDHKNICWFSGLKMARSKRTIEHLVSKRILRGHGKYNYKWNVVPADKTINALIGNAPLKVKFALREVLHGLIMHPALDLEKQRLTCVSTTKAWLETFRIGTNLPWATNWTKPRKMSEKEWNKLLQLREEWKKEWYSDEELRLEKMQKH